MTRLTRAMTPLLSAFAALCALTAHAAPPVYTLQPIQQAHPDLVNSTPAMMNNNGQLAGYAHATYVSNMHLALWNSTVLTDGGAAPHWILDWIDMNDNGQMLGFTIDDERKVHGFIYQNGVYQTIPNFQYGAGINASGKVPFWNQSDGAYSLWNNGNTTPLPMTATIDGIVNELSDPFAINDHDEIAYIAYTPPLYTPQLYVYGANPFAVPAPNQFIVGQIVGMNNSRQIAGEYMDGAEHPTPFLYSDNGTHGHGTYQLFPEEYHLRKLNERGEILAQKEDGDYAIFHENGWHNLNSCIPAGWTIACTYDLNDKGEIAAMVFDGQETQLVILKPQNNNTLQGQITLPNPSGKTVRITITGATTQTATVTLDAQGRFTLPINITGAATLRLKAANTLATAVTMTLSNGENTLPASVALRGGDANDDNVVDISDLLMLIAHYNATQPSANYLSAADFDNNGTNDIGDLLVLIANYNRLGD